MFYEIMAWTWDNMKISLQIHNSVSEHPKEMQNETVCQVSSEPINVSKTKGMLFGPRKKRSKEFTFNLHGEPLHIVVKL